MPLNELMLMAIACLLQSFAVIYIINKLLNIKGFKKLLFSVLIMWFILALKSSIDEAHHIFLLLGAIAMPFGAIIITKMFTKSIKLYEIAAALLIFYVVAVITELVFAAVFVLFSLELDSLSRVNLALVNIAATTIKLIIFLLIEKKCIAITNKIKSILKALSQNTIISILIILTIIVSLLVLYLTVFISGEDSVTPFLLYSFVIIFVYFMICLLIYKEYKNQNLLKERELLIRYNKMFEQILKNQRKATHEHENELILIKSLIDNKQYPEAIDEINKKLKITGNNQYSELIKVVRKINDDSPLKQILLYKLMEFESASMPYDLNISYIKKNNISIKDGLTIGKIVGILLDNAYENTIKNQAIIIDIKVKKSEFILEVTNQISKKRLKQSGMIKGVGLDILDSLVRKNKRFKHNTEIIDNVYVQKIYYKK